MTAPVAASVNTVVDTSLTATTANLQPPAGSAAGDLLIGFAVWKSDQTHAPQWPAGWTAITSQIDPNGTPAYSLAWHIFTAGETSYQVTYPSGAARAAGIVRVTGSASDVSAINAFGSSNEASGSFTVAAPSVTASVDECLVLHFFDASASGSWTPPSGETPLWALDTTRSLSTTASCTTQAIAGATAVVTATRPGTGNYADAITVAIAPAATAPTGIPIHHNGGTVTIHHNGGTVTIHHNGQ